MTCKQIIFPNNHNKDFQTPVCVPTCFHMFFSQAIIIKSSENKNIIMHKYLCCCYVTPKQDSIIGILGLELQGNSTMELHPGDIARLISSRINCLKFFDSLRKSLKDRLAWGSWGIPWLKQKTELIRDYHK